MIAVIILSFIFMFSELFLSITKRTKSDLAKIRKDRGTEIINWLAIAGGLTAGFFLARYSVWSTINYLVSSAGILIFISGVLIRWIAVSQLKESFTVDVSISKTHVLKTDGLYSNIRHPSYLGLILITFGLSVAMNSWKSILMVMVPVLIALNYRIFVEERILTGEFGGEYLNYKSRTRKLIPGIF
ncbi:MAG: isoprenylcysteine carboxylmethyltransferase family protein [Bacteroidales bacterium]|jgi:protein-S-isoprenylcysteine O-methyltransferase Ste14